MKVIVRFAALGLFAGMLGFLSCRAQTGVQSPANANSGAPPPPANDPGVMLPASKAGPVFFRPPAQPAQPAQQAAYPQSQQAPNPPSQAPNPSQAPMQSVP
ncbi:MAG TPA: hypothetical protein VFF06_23560 [Polyangia bacterium]|nr:hypothetical protein [Polyangia bacterium]